MLINVKMPTIVGILAFMSRINCVLSRVEHEKSFITSGPGLLFGENILKLFSGFIRLARRVKRLQLTRSY